MMTIPLLRFVFVSLRGLEWVKLGNWGFWRGSAVSIRCPWVKLGNQGFWRGSAVSIVYYFWNFKIRYLTNQMEFQVEIKIFWKLTLLGKITDGCFALSMSSLLRKKLKCKVTRFLGKIRPFLENNSQTINY